jgi:sulfur-carrier protein
MPIAVKIASPLRSYTSGAASVDATGSTVSEVLADLDRRFPGIRFRMIDEQNRIRQHIRLFVNTDAAKTLNEPVRDGDTVHLICALSGGGENKSAHLLPPPSWGRVGERVLSIR